MEFPTAFFRVRNNSTMSHRLAKDFFTKLCAYPPSERYDSKMALAHPWITGGVGEIPMTRKQKMRVLNSQMELKRAIRSVLFCVMVKGPPPIDRDYKRLLESHVSDSS